MSASATRYLPTVSSEGRPGETHTRSRALDMHATGWNSVIGLVSAQPAQLSFSYDAAHKQLVVGRPAENIVSLFTPDQVFSDGFN